MAAARELHFQKNLENIQIGIDGKSAMVNFDLNVIYDVVAMSLYLK